MRVVLVNPASDITRSLNRIRRSMSLVLPPVGLAYIAAVLEENKIDVKVIDQFGDDLDSAKVIETIGREVAHVVGFSCFTPNMGVVEQIAKGIKKHNPEIKIILGNIHASVFASEILTEGWADIVVHGEGEYTLLKIVEALENDQDLKQICGISYKENGKVYHNSLTTQINDLDSLPYPAWHLFNVKNYPAPIALSGSGPLVTISTSRGCAYRCFFCTEGVIFKQVKKRNMVKVVDEIEAHYERLKIKTFGFSDASFPLSREDGLSFSDELIRRKLNKEIGWFIESRVDSVDLELLKRMKEAGLKLIMYGFEVGNEKILTQINKRTTLDCAVKAMEYTKKAGILSIGLFILGLPGETKKSCAETIKFARKLDCDFVSFHRAVPFPGSKFFETYKDKISMKDFPDRCNMWNELKRGEKLIYTPEGMTSSELVSLQKKAMFRYYVRPHLIARHIIKRTVSLKDFCAGAKALVKSYFPLSLR